MEKRASVQHLLEQYPELIRKISILRFELQHPSTVSPDDMIDTMNFEHRTGEGLISGVVSNKTMYIALNYRDHADQVNRKHFDEIASRLVPLERSIERLQHYVSLLDKRMAHVIRSYYFDCYSWDEIASQLGLSVRSVQKLKNTAVDKLTEMYEFADSDI